MAAIANKKSDAKEISSSSFTAVKLKTGGKNRQPEETHILNPLLGNKHFAALVILMNTSL